MDDFAAFILTHGRPDRVLTYGSLRRSGYTGRIVLLVDDLDKTKDEYLARFGSEVEVFDKRAVAAETDAGDNFQTLKSVLFARNANFDIAKRLGIKYFVQLDDDYRHFQFRFNEAFEYQPRVMKNLDAVFAALVRFYKSTPIHCIAMAQGGDYIGGEDCQSAQSIRLKRKSMNSFFCSTERPFKFIGTMNDDVNTYVRNSSVGLLFFTTNQVSLEQLQTQTNAGGLTDLYLQFGTYVKSFYSVMYMPSAVKVRILRDRENSRLHHVVSWNNVAPMILRESYRKSA